MEIKKGKLIIFSAPSGSGKTTLVHYLMKQIPELAFSVSATNRKPRPEEKNGIDYYFLSTEEFKRKIDSGDFVEWEEVYPGQFYGTLKSEVESKRNKGKTVVFDVDVKGGINIKKLYGDEALAVFVKPPSIAVLKERLLHRSTEDADSIKKRLERAEYELTFEKYFDKVIINGDLDKSKKSSIDIVLNFLNGEKNSKNKYS